MIWLWLWTHCCLCHIIWSGVNMMPMWHDCSYICFIYAIWFSPYLLFWEFWLRSLSFFKYRSRHDSNYECILLADMQNLQPQMTLYLHEVESLMMILSSSSLVSLSLPLSASLTRLLWISLTDTCSDNFGTICGSVWPSIFTFRQSLTIGDLQLENDA